MKVQEKLKQFQLERKAILATNFYNYETLKGILEAASRVQAPVMLQLTKSSIDYMGLKRAVVLARQGLEDYRLDGCIHLDHGGSVESDLLAEYGKTAESVSLRILGVTDISVILDMTDGGEYRNDL